MNSLPTLAVMWGVRVDRLRRVVRRDPALQSLGVAFGPTRIYSDAEAKQILDAFERDQSANKRKQPASR